MNLRDLQYIIAVAETRHFGHAAEKCCVSQPTLSGQIKKLEDELGIVLFERTNRSVEITPIGEDIVYHARLILERAQLIKQLSQAHRDPLAGALRVGAIPTISPYLIPLILMPLKETYPQMRLVLSEEITESLLGRLRDHSLDAAIIATSVEEESDLNSIPLFDEPFWFAHPRNHKLYDQDEITLEDLKTEQILLLSEGHCFAEQAMSVCQINERNPDDEFADLRAGSLETLLQFVGAGFGSTLVPALAIRGSWTTDSGVIVRQLSIPDARRTIRLAYRHSFPRQAALHALTEVILNHLPNTVTKLQPGPVNTN
ncbi:MAG: LysR substrate-binding domain-containing protein [Thiotrichales bacterium]